MPAAAGAISDSQSDAQPDEARFLRIRPLVRPLSIHRTADAGQTPNRNAVVRHNAVAKGDPVRLIVADGKLLIETQAVAIEDSELGGLVKVRPDKAAEAIVGRLVSPGVVQAGER